MNIELNRVGFRYGRRDVLHDVTWLLGGGVSGLLGPNGAGKTTLLHLLAGITKPQRGEIVFQEHDRQTPSTASSYGRRIGFVPQHFTFTAEMRVLDTVSYAAWIHGTPRKNCVAAARQALQQVDLTAKTSARVRTLSGGQRQRLGLATALAHDPEVLILDEPTVGLDPGQRLKLREVIAAIGARRPVVISTHLVDDITHLCQQVGIIADGRMIFDGTVEQLAALVEESHPHEGLGTPFERAYTGIIRSLGGTID